MPLARRNELRRWRRSLSSPADGGSRSGIAAATTTLTTKKSSDQARSLAEQHRRDYSAQIVSNIGCT